MTEKEQIQVCGYYDKVPSTFQFLQSWPLSLIYAYLFVFCFVPYAWTVFHNEAREYQAHIRLDQSQMCEAVVDLPELADACSKVKTALASTWIMRILLHVWSRMNLWNIGILIATIMFGGPMWIWVRGLMRMLNRE